MELYGTLKAYIRKERSLVVWAIICLTCSTALGLVYPNLLRFLIDDVVMERQFGLAPYLAFAVVGIVGAKAGFAFLFGHLGGLAGNRFTANLRNALYDKLQKLSFSFYDKAKTGDLMSRLTADLDVLRHFVSYELGHLFNFCTCLVLGALFMAAMSWQLTLLILIAMPLLGFLAVRFQNRIQPAFRAIRTAMSGLTTAVQENVSGVRTVKAFARESFEYEKFTARSEEYKNKHLDSAYIWARYFPAMELTASLSTVILLGAGGYLVLRGRLSIGELVAFFGLAGYIIAPLWHLGYHINVYTQTKAAGERLVELLQQYVQIKDLPDALALPPAYRGGHVRFENVTFSYDGIRNVIEHLHIDAPPGKITGIMGGTGSGKTTAVALLLRAYPVREGRITLDGRDIQELRLRDLREQTAVVFQETFLFSSSIRGNIAYGRPDASALQIEEAAKLAQAHSFIMELPEGYDTVVGERGLGLSGGQKQRIAIARALLREPKLLILDDATSAVDMETEHEIQLGLRSLRGTTTFIIAHRLSSLQHADEIIVLEQGLTVQRGTHEELLGHAGPYRHIFDKQYAGSASSGARDSAVREGGNQR